LTQQPVSEAFGISIRQQVNDLTPFQIHQDSSVAVSALPSPIIYAQHSRRNYHRLRGLPEVAQQCVGADWETQLGSQPGASFTAQCKSDGFQGLLLPDRPSTIHPGHLIQPLGKYLARAVAISAVELANGDPPVNLLASPR
jgi:hypothetical protein